MRNALENRWLFFFFGLTVGVIISVFIFNSYFKANLFSSQKIDVINKVDLVNKKPEKTVNKTKKTKTRINKPAKEKPLVKDSLLPEIQSDSIRLDSMGLDTLAVFDSLENSVNLADIVVAKDELLFSKQMIPTGDAKVFLCDDFSELDSILVDNVKVISQEGLLVEFWKSPVNFQGYKLNKRRLVLFGVMEFDSLNLEFQEGKSLILHYKNQNFELKCTQDFLPLNILK